LNSGKREGKEGIKRRTGRKGIRGQGDRE